jgi:hypothetical protein
MDDGPRQSYALLGLLLSAAAPATGAPGAPAEDEFLSLLEFLGDAELAGDPWSEFFDSVPEPPASGPDADDAAPPADPEGRP